MAFENLTYHKEGDYLIPDLALPEEDASDVPLGKYGRMRKRYLKEQDTVTYNILLLSGKLMAHLAEVQQEATEMMDRLTSEMAKAEGVTEQLKAEDQMEWVGRMNSIRNRAEEIVLNDLIYS